jgi:hypothetical protein
LKLEAGSVVMVMAAVTALVAACPQYPCCDLSSGVLF